MYSYWCCVFLLSVQDSWHTVALHSKVHSPKPKAQSPKPKAQSQKLKAQSPKPKAQSRRPNTLSHHTY